MFCLFHNDRVTDGFAGKFKSTCRGLKDGTGNKFVSLCFIQVFQKFIYHLYIDDSRTESSIEETVMVLKCLVEEYQKYPPVILFYIAKN